MEKQNRSFKVQTLSNQIYPFQTSLDTKVFNIKKMIFERTTIPFDRQKLMFDSKVLEDQEPISTYLKNDDHTIFLLSRPDNTERKEKKNQFYLQQKMPNYQDYNQSSTQEFSQGFNRIPSAGNQFSQQQQRSAQFFYPGPLPGVIPTYRVPPPSSIVPFQEPQLSLNQLTAMSEIINEMGKLPSPPIPAFIQNSSPKRLGQYFSQWHYEMTRLLPHVYKLSQLLQKQDYLSRIGRLQTQQHIFTVSTALQALVNSTVPLIMQSSKVGTAINNFNPHFTFERSGSFKQTFPSPPPRAQSAPNADGTFDFRQYPYGFNNSYDPIPMKTASPYWDGKPPKTALSISYGDGDYSSVPLKQLVGNFTVLKSVWLQLFGEASINQLFFVLSGDDVSYIQKNRQKISNKIDQRTASKISGSLTSIIVNQGLDPEGGLSSYIYQRLIPHIELILHLTKQGKANYSEQVLRQIKAGLGEILYEVVQSTSKNIEFVADATLITFKKILSDCLPHSETYFTILSGKLKKGMMEVFNEYQRKIEDERNRLII